MRPEEIRESTLSLERQRREEMHPTAPERRSSKGHIATIASSMTPDAPGLETSQTERSPQEEPIRDGGGPARPQRLQEARPKGRLQDESVPGQGQVVVEFQLVPEEVHVPAEAGELLCESEEGAVRGEDRVARAPVARRGELQGGLHGVAGLEREEWESVKDHVF